MERINASESFRIRNTNTHFEMIFVEKTDTNKAFEAMKEAIKAVNYDDPYLPDYAPLFVQDLGDSRTDESFVTDSSLQSGEYEEYLPVMLKAVAKALPKVPFKGYSRFDATNCYDIHEIEFSYNGKQLYLKSTYKNDECGYFCPDCGCFIAGVDEEFDSDEIECEDCEETFKVSDLKYVPAEVSEETIEF